MTRRIAVAGTLVDDVDEQGVLDFVRDRVAIQCPARIVTVNAEYVVRAVHDPEFAATIRSADLATVDGWGVLWAARKKGSSLTDRVGGSDLIWSLCRQASEEGHRVFLLGAAPGVAARAAQILRSRFPSLKVVGTHSGTPLPRDEGHIGDMIMAASADILFVAFGSPAQDHWIARNLEKTGVSVAIGVGGTFDYVAGVAKRAPLWMRRRGLEWLWRLLRQPWRWRRMLNIPRFLWLVVVLDRLGNGSEPEERTTARSTRGD